MRAFDWLPAKCPSTLFNSPLQCGESNRTDPVLPVPDTGGKELNGGFLPCSVLPAMSGTGGFWVRVQPQLQMAETWVGTGRGAESWACAGAAPGAGTPRPAGGDPCCCPALALRAGRSCCGAVCSLSGFRQGRNPAFICF